MPTVPVYSNTTERLRPLADTSQPTNRGAAEFGGAAAKQLQDVSRAVMDATLRISQQNDEHAVFEASAKLLSQAMERRAEYLSLQGAEAMGITEKEAEAWRKDYAEATSKLTPHQQDLLFRRVENTRLTHIESLSRHEVQQRRKAEIDEIEAFKGLSIDAAAKIGSIDAISVARDTVVKHNDKLSRLLGWTPATLAAETQKDISRLHAAVINGMLQDNRAEEAEAYYRANAAEMTERARQAVQPHIETSVRLRVAQMAGDEAIAKFDSLDEALKWVRSTHKPGKTREDVESEVTRRFRERDAMAEREKKAASDQVVDLVVKQGVPLTQVPAPLIARMDPQVLESLRKLTGSPPPYRDASLEAMQNLRRLAVEDPDLFTRLDLNTLRHTMRPEHFDQIDTLQLSMLRREPKNNDQVTLNQLMQAAIDRHEWLGKGKADIRGAFHDYVYRQVMQESQLRGRPLTAREMQDIIDGALVEHKPAWYIPSRYTFQLRPGAVSEPKDAAQIPQSERDLLVRVIRIQRGDPRYNPTDEELREAYKYAQALKSQPTNPSRGK